MAECGHKQKNPCNRYLMRKRDQDDHHEPLNGIECGNQRDKNVKYHRPRSSSLHSSLLQSHFQRPLAPDRRHSIAVNGVRTRENDYMDRNADSVAHCLFEAMRLAKDDHEKVDKHHHRRAKSLKYKSERHNEDNSFRRVRSFKTTTKGIVGKTETVTREQTSLAMGRDLMSAENDIQSPPGRSVIPKVAAVRTVDRVKHYRVLALGTEGVGKSSIIGQFMSSDISDNEGTGIAKTDDRRVTLEVDGEETVLEFLQAKDFQGSEKNLSLNAFLVVFATTDRRSFDRAVEVLKHLRDEVGPHKAVILVGNKTDLVRHRHVTTEDGRHIADMYGCKYIETSATLNLQVDELLVGICKQIALKNDHTPTTDSRNEAHGCNRRRSSFHKAKRFLQKAFHIHSYMEKNTENLYVD